MSLTDGEKNFVYPIQNSDSFLNSSAGYVVSPIRGVFSVRQGLDFYILLKTHRGFPGPCHGEAQVRSQLSPREICGG